ncbi:MAG TPA: S-layer homology domain-containing protein, partial [Pyrinomonadaceae bacterium]|nr:S-layer homology domain-containing protein [Pyrinomonadaceae bacterium]
FADIRNDSLYYEAVSNLTENYKIAFGYADKKFYADAPLTRGDFAQYLRSTLDLLSERAVSANKLPLEIGLFYPHNPQKTASVSFIKDVKPNAPFYESVKTLLLKYDISLTNDKNEFQGRLHLTNNELIDRWSKIFGAEAIPVNFGLITEGDRIISRGEFALFLDESLQVLTYKVLP